MRHRWAALPNHSWPRLAYRSNIPEGLTTGGVGQYLIVMNPTALHWLVAVLLSFSSMSPVAAQAGMTREEVMAFESHKAKAEKGDPEAQHQLGISYGNGKGVATDDVIAVSWYRKAAEQGHRDAQHFLGRRYMTGKGVEMDKAEAIFWFKKAAEKGNTSAQLDLGHCLFN